MISTKMLPLLFPEARHDEEPQVVHLNGHCKVSSVDGQYVVSVHGVVVSHYTRGDHLGEAYAMVNLVSQGYALQSEVAAGFGCSTRTVRRNLRRFETEGVAGLGRGPGYPRGRPRLSSSRQQLVNDLKAQGVSNREIARRLGVTEKAVRNLLKRLGWTPSLSEQLEMPPMDADSNLSDLSISTTAIGGPKGDPSPPDATVTATEDDADRAVDADSNLSAFDAVSPDEVLFSLDHDPTDRRMDRVLASKGLLDDAVPLFRPGLRIPGAGALLAIPAIVDSGVVDVAREIYGSIGPAFYGLRTTIVTVVMMALMRIKHPEGLKERSPLDLGRLVGLDRAPEVKTVRRKLERLAAVGRAIDFGRSLAQERVKRRGHVLGFLYVDGHVRAYHGKRKLPKTHVARIRIAMPAATDYWVNDSEGEPLFVVNTEANKGLVKILPVVLDEVRTLIGDRRVTIVFDRGGWSPKLFKKLLAAGFDILTYRKGRWRKVVKKRFELHQATIDGRKIEYRLADQNILLLKRTLRLRQVTRLTDNGHQTPIVTSRHDLPPIEVAYRMFERWRQENFFKYLRQEYALDALVDYSTEPADPTRDVPNPARKKIDAELTKARAELLQLQSVYGVEALINPETRRPSMRGFKIANAPVSNAIYLAAAHVIELERKRAAIPTRVPVQKVTKGDVIKLRTEVKLISDLLKMVAYQVESDMVRLITPHYRRSEDEGRTLVQNAMEATGDIEISDNALRVTLEPLSSPHRTHAMAALCEHLNDTKTTFPGTKLVMHFDVKPQPDTTLAFPGPRPEKESTGELQPDSL